ncbi:MAG: hypothetical protein MUF72_12250 [Elainella sp. Prado103]|nr:hypothetical protein [Elainella sp. Prado103]
MHPRRGYSSASSPIQSYSVQSYSVEEVQDQAENQVMQKPITEAIE